MKHLRNIGMIIGMVVLFAFSVSAANIADSIAVISEHAGNVKVYQENKWHNAAVNMPVYEKAVFKTGNDSYVEITFDDATIIRLDDNTELKLTEMKRKSNKARTIFNLAKGSLLAIVDKLRNPDSSFEIHTKMAIAAVKGTELLVIADDQDTQLAVNEGSVQFRGAGEVSDDGNHGDGKVVLVRAGKYSTVNVRIKAPGVPKNWRAQADITRTFNKVREEVKIIRELKKQGGDAVIEWRKQKVLKNENGEVIGSADQKVTLGGKNEADTKRAQNRIKNHLKNKLRNNMNDSAKRAWHDLKFVNGEMKADLNLGKTMTDVKGRRIRMEEYVFRPRPEELDLLSVTFRNDRLDYLRARNVYNNPLPKDLLAHPELFRTTWLIRPETYKLYEHITLSNTTDFVETGVRYGYDGYAYYAAAPLSLAPEETYVPGPITVVDNQITYYKLNAYERMIAVNGSVKEHDKYLVSRSDGTKDWRKMADDRSYYSVDEIALNAVHVRGASIGDTGALSNLSEGFKVIGTGELQNQYDYEYSDSLVAQATNEFNTTGSYAPASAIDTELVWRERRNYNDGTWLQLDTILIDDYGKIQQISSGRPLADFFDVLFNTNVELIVNSNMFQEGDIDVVSKFLWWTMLAPNK